MRKLIWFTLGFLAACALAAYVLAGSAVKICCGAAFVCACVAAILGRRSRVFAGIGLVLLGFCLGSFRYGIYNDRYLTAPAEMDGKTRNVTIRTTDYSTPSDYGTATEGILDLGGKRYRVKLWLDSTDPLEPGCLITGNFRFAATAPKEDPISYHSGKGIFLLAFQTDEVTLEKDTRILWQDRTAQLRQWLRDTIHNSIPEDAEPFARALLLGDTTLLDYKTDTDMKVSGIRHVVAVSGLHISILMGLLGNVTFRRKYLTVPLGLAVLVLFSALVGFSPSVTRACIMSGLMLLAMLFDREYDASTALSVSVLVMLLVNPLVVASASFQLSVAAVAGIFLVDPKLRPWLNELLPQKMEGKWWGRFAKSFCASVSVTVGAMALTTPLCACYFGMISLVSVVTNLLVLWVIGGIFYGIMAVCLLDVLGIPLVAFLGRMLAYIIRFVLGAAGMMAKFPLAAVYMDSMYAVLWLCFLYLLLAAFLFSGKKNPTTLLCCGILSLCAAMLGGWSETSDTVVTVLDVGQGQCILLQSEGRTYMVDCGGDDDSRVADIAAGYLLSRGINRLDGMILTHLDSDHAGGAENLLSRIETEILILPNAHTTLSAQNTVFAAEDLRLTWGNTEITIFAPTFPGSSNEKSLCVLFDTEKCDILITGDRDAFGERMLLRRAQIPKVDVLIAGHHGSKNSTCEELLQAVSPEIVCISAGKDNPYGHPASELLERLAAYGCTVYRTDLNGTITIRR